MLKKIGFSVALLGGLMAFAAPRPAKAEVHFGVYIGAPAPVYRTVPAYPAPARFPARSARAPGMSRRWPAP